MERRTFLASSGVLIAGLAGCSDGGSDSGSGYETLDVGGEAVPLVPVDDARSWHEETDTEFVDARGSEQYQRAHIIGATLSSARRVKNWSEPRQNDPTADWSEDQRIVCYCRCPHHLSSLRAGELISKGYQNVYAIDEGFGAWIDKGYPTTGSEANASFVVRGRTDPADAGEYAWASHEASDQQEAVPIAEDGSYQMTLHFGDIDPSSPINLRTPSYELTAPLSQLTDDVVTGPV